MVDLSLWLPALCARLNAAGVADLVFWTEAELYQRATGALHSLARESNLFCEACPPITSAEPLVPIPAEHLALFLVARDGTVLTPASVAELEALDSDWEETAVSGGGSVTHWVGDYLGLRFLRFYPIPATSADVLLVRACLPSIPTAKSAGVAIPAPFADYLALATLRDARAKQGDARMPEVAQHIDQRLKLYDQVVQAYWGGGY